MSIAIRSSAPHSRGRVRTALARLSDGAKPLPLMLERDASRFHDSLGDVARGRDVVEREAELDATRGHRAFATGEIGARGCDARECSLISPSEESTP